MKNLLSVVILILSSSAMAQTGYGGVGVTAVDASDEVSLTAMFARLGTDFNKNFSGEIRSAFGVNSGSIGASGERLNVDLKSLHGVYVRTGIPVQSFFPYFIFGPTLLDFEYSGLGFSMSDSESDFSFGVGADIKVGDLITINIEYMDYSNKGSADVTGVSLSFVAAF